MIRSSYSSSSSFQYNRNILVNSSAFPYIHVTSKLLRWPPSSLPHSSRLKRVLPLDHGQDLWLASNEKNIWIMCMSLYYIRLYHCSSCSPFLSCWLKKAGNYVGKPHMTGNCRRPLGSESLTADYEGLSPTFKG